jgi:ABC-type dipeptide/oligopeptide/nickel transport system permease component
VVLSHVLRNAMMAPITVIMLHINWLIGGLVVVESVFGYPGMGNFILNAALYKDIYSIEAGAMVLIVLAVRHTACGRHHLFVSQPAHSLHLRRQAWLNRPLH